MSHVEFSAGAAPVERPVLPAVRRISALDLRNALKAGLGDFWAMPTHVVFLVIIYPIIGLVLARVTMGEKLLPLVYPLMAGFALVGPFAAIGLYELSRRREKGLDVGWKHAFDVFESPSRASIAALGVLEMLIFIVWIATAHWLDAKLFGSVPSASIPEFLDRVFSTPAGWALIILGNAIGFVFAAVTLTLTVVSFPLLLDRDVGVAAAIATSVRAVQANPAVMALWGLIIAAALLAGSLPFFIGLALVLPILGHATWHLYRRVVVSPEDGGNPVGERQAATSR